MLSRQQHVSRQFNAIQAMDLIWKRLGRWKTWKWTRAKLAKQLIALGSSRDAEADVHKVWAIWRLTAAVNSYIIRTIWIKLQGCANELRLQRTGARSRL